jgi:DNA-binding NarL/FixJ family response regulator
VTVGEVLTRTSTRVWVDDPNPVFRRGLVACLDHDVVVVGESRELDPAPLIDGVDVLLFSADGPALARALSFARQSSRCGLVAIVDEVREEDLLRAVEAGVGSILVRSTLEPLALVAAVESVALGATAISSALIPRLLRQAELGSPRHASGLTDRELNVLRHMSVGLDTREIADTMGYSERTVKNLVHDLVTKMNCRNRVHAVAYASRMGIL